MEKMSAESINYNATWDRRFMSMAELVAAWSKDQATQVGCVIVGPNREIRGIGYNGFPRGLDDEKQERHERPAKYDWTEHAERNAVYQAARVGIPTAGCTMYLTWFPCVDCARAVVQSGIRRLVAISPDKTDERWGAQFQQAEAMLLEAGVKVHYLQSA